MSFDPSVGNQNLTIKAFRRARWQARVEQIRARLAGRSADLLCYWDVQDLLVLDTSQQIGQCEIPLASIVGSVERCREYTRGFLPLRDSDERRWIGVKKAFSDARSLPPIRVFQVGEVYFVADGNHRVSVARQHGLTHIKASVVQIQAKVRLSPGDQAGELILKREQSRFLQNTGLDDLRPEADLRFTVPARYRILEVQIEAHRAFLALDQRQEVAGANAVCDWYDNVYLPVVKAIRDRDLLRDFPAWTEADLYLALCEHRLALEEAVGQQVSLERAVADLARQVPPHERGVVAQLRRGLFDALRR